MPSANHSFSSLFWHLHGETTSRMAMVKGGRGQDSTASNLQVQKRRTDATVAICLRTHGTPLASETGLTLGAYARLVRRSCLRSATVT